MDCRVKPGNDDVEEKRAHPPLVGTALHAFGHPTLAPCASILVNSMTGSERQVPQDFLFVVAGCWSQPKIGPRHIVYEAKNVTPRLAARSDRYSDQVPTFRYLPSRVTPTVAVGVIIPPVTIDVVVKTYRDIDRLLFVGCNVDPRRRQQLMLIKNGDWRSVLDANGLNRLRCTCPSRWH
jgi:hypothetical protein